MGLTGCASSKTDAALVNPHLPQNAEAAPATPNTPKILSINLTPYTTYTDNWSLDGNGLDNKNIKQLGGNFSDSYTRLIITSKLDADGNKNSEDKIAEYPYKPRNGLMRWLYGKEFSINFTAKVAVDALEETIPLVTVGHESNSGGEKWSRIVSHADRNHPLFLVKGNGNGAIPKITVTMHGSTSYASRGAASALQVVVGAINAVSPNAPVITTLSSQASKDRASALDNAISKLFSTDVKEEHTTTPDFRLWNEENKQPNGIKVTLNIPADESWSDSEKEAKAQHEKNQIGIWTITFDYPRPSIFSDWRICDKTDDKTRCKTTKEEAKQHIMKELNPSEILNYNLLNDGQKLNTIRTFLAQQEWFAHAQTKLVAAKAKESGDANAKQNTTQPKDSPVKSAAIQMCRNIRNSITGLNLNGFDADIVVWAMLKGLPWPDGSPSYEEMKAIDGCDAIAM